MKSRIITTFDAKHILEDKLADRLKLSIFNVISCVKNNLIYVKLN